MTVTCIMIAELQTCKHGLIISATINFVILSISSAIQFVEGEKTFETVSNLL